MNLSAPNPSLDDLHRRAESILEQRERNEPVGEADLQRLFHELQVHQIELELQNEELRKTQAENQEAMRQLADFNDRLEELVSVRTADLVTARNAAEAASRAKSMFLANMSHELRTPMNAIIGMTDMVLRQASDPKLIDRLSKVKAASLHLLGIINDILDLSKIEADRLELAHIGFKLSSVVRSLTGMLSPQAEQKGLAFDVEIASGLAETPLLGDPMHLTQILLNLIGNAIKFTAKGSVRLRVLADEESESEMAVRFEVSDTGIGICVEDQQRIFSAFEQADGSLTRNYGGTGLGLAISRSLVKLMGGNIGLESVPEHGSTFWLTVRLNKTTADNLTDRVSTDHASGIRLKSDWAGKHILLAEDEPINQEVARALLEDVGLVVDVANNGQEAIDLACHNIYALILMDIQMPELNGLEATQAIRTESLNKSTPILAMTANAFSENRQDCLAAGMNEHISKPFEPERLYAIMLEWLGKREP